jgi:hypothetical protein
MAAITGGPMNTEERLPVSNGVSPFKRIRGTNAAGAEYWSSRDFAQVLGYSDYRNFEQVVKRAKTAGFNSGQRVGDYLGEITEMIAKSIKNRESRMRKRPEALEPPPSEMDATDALQEEGGM